LDTPIRPRREIQSAAEMRAPLAPTTIRTICLIMNFVTLCCGTSLNFCSGAPVSALLSSVARYASELNTSCLSCHLLMTVSALERSRSNIQPNKFVRLGVNKVPWEIALSCPRSDILVACKSTLLNGNFDWGLTNGAACLSSSVLTVQNLEGLRMCTAVEIWEYLRDVLLLTLAGHYVGDEAPLSLLVAPTICGAMLALLCQTGDPLSNQFSS
jgi:hypothetical protein